jgi:cytochrome c oxidase subunit III
MPAPLTDKLVPTRPGSGGGTGGRDGERHGGGDGGPGDGAPALLGDPARFGLLAFLGTVSMLFIGFTSAYILRRASADWQPLAAPPVLWLNTAALLASSGTLEVARRRLRGWDRTGAQLFLTVTGVLGLAFAAGQVVGWRQLAEMGVFLSSNPHSSFFYLLTGVHVVHLLAGLVWFTVVLYRLRRMALLPGEDGLGLFATYWHFLGALWVYLLWLLFVY